MVSIPPPNAVNYICRHKFKSHNSPYARRFHPYYHLPKYPPATWPPYSQHQLSYWEAHKRKHTSSARRSLCRPYRQLPYPSTCIRDLDGHIRSTNPPSSWRPRMRTALGFSGT